MKKEKIINVLEYLLNCLDGSDRSGKILFEDAITLLDNLDKDEISLENLEEDLYDGAGSWHEYSHNGCACAMYYNRDIVARYRPDLINSPEKWNSEELLDIQASALFWAYELIYRQLSVFSVLEVINKSY